MAKSLDIAKDIATRNYQRPSWLIYPFYRLILDITYRKFKMNINRVDDVGKEKGGCLVLFNHLSRLDHYYIMRAVWPKRMTMICEYNEFFRSHLNFVFRLEQIVPKKNYCNDVLTIKTIFKLLRKNACIALAAEGLATNDGTPKPIVPGTGHLIKKCKVPVYFAEQKGLYLQNTKTCLDIRYGETFVTTKLLFSKEDIERLSADEIDAKINEAFWHDEYAWNKEHHYKYETNGRSCERLDDLLYKCPKCGESFNMEGKDDHIKCLSCGNGATLDDYYDFHPFDGSIIPNTVTDWVNQERIDIIREIRKDPNYSFTEKCELGYLPNDHYLKDYKTSDIVGSGELTVDHNGVHYRDFNDSTKNMDLTYNEIYTLITVTDSSNFSFYYKGEYREIHPERHTVIFINMLIEEMHRLHVNFYKNFPWKDYMYKEEDE